MKTSTAICVQDEENEFLDADSDWLHWISSWCHSLGTDWQYKVYWMHSRDQGCCFQISEGPWNLPIEIRFNSKGFTHQCILSKQFVHSVSRLFERANW